MRRIRDEKRLSKMLDEYGFKAIFSADNLPFSLWHYEKRELLNGRKKMMNRLVFLLSGTISIDHIREDGNASHICTVEGLTLLGDMEFIRGEEGDFLVEAETELLCVELPTTDCKEELWQDPVFLRFCLQSVSNKLQYALRADVTANSLEEKLLQYLQFNCQDGKMKGVQAAADQLHCSRRQLQRVLKKMCEAGQIHKEGKGIYQLSESYLGESW